MIWRSPRSEGLLHSFWTRRSSVPKDGSIRYLLVCIFMNDMYLRMSYVMSVTFYLFAAFSAPRIDLRQVKTRAGWVPPLPLMPLRCREVRRLKLWTGYDVCVFLFLFALWLGCNIMHLMFKWWNGYVVPFVHCSIDIYVYIYIYSMSVCSYIYIWYIW